MPDTLTGLAARGYRMISPEEYEFLQSALKFAGTRAYGDYGLAGAVIHIEEIREAYDTLRDSQKAHTDATEQ